MDHLGGARDYHEVDVTEAVMTINTVLGPIEADQLGPTLIHEHISAADWSMRANFGERFFQDDKVVDAAVLMCDKVKRECGVTTIVDGTPINLGRDVRLIREVARRTGMNIIASTGFYYTPEPWLATFPEDELVELMLGECRDGIDGTGIRPGIMKCAVGEAGLTPLVRKLVTTVARVAAQTGLPIFCHHTVDSRNGGDILDIVEEQGVPLNRFILGHSGDTDDLDYLTAMLRRGCYLGMDRFAYCGLLLGLDRRVATIAALHKAGYGERMLLSHDLVVYGFSGSWDQFVATDPLRRDPDLTFIHRQVFPGLLAAGLTQADVDAMIEQNPRRFFAGE
jgi:phosphotriesterase-related protein